MISDSIAKLVIYLITVNPFFYLTLTVIFPKCFWLFPHRWRKRGVEPCVLRACDLYLNMSRKYKFHDQDRLYFVTYAVVDWVDVFTRNEYRNIVLDSLKYCCANKGLELYAWCLMTNHVHLVIGTRDKKMEDILRDHKSFTADALLKAIVNNKQESRREWMLSVFAAAGHANSNNANYQFWQQHNNPIELYSLPVITQKLDYIHKKPVNAGFVSHAEDWLYSSARDYACKPGLLDCVTPIDIGIWG